MTLDSYCKSICFNQGASVGRFLYQGASGPLATHTDNPRLAVIRLGEKVDEKNGSVIVALPTLAFKLTMIRVKTSYLAHVRFESLTAET